MLGQIARQAPLHQVEISNTLTEALMEHWTERGEVIVPTMKPQADEWREFWLYASSAHKWCPRKFALMVLYGKHLTGAETDADTKWLFEQGHAYHNMLQQDALMSLPRDVFLGSWKRLVMDADATKRHGHAVFHREVAEGPQPFSDGDVIRGWLPRPEGEGWEYVESKVRIHDLRIVVKMDGVLAWPGKPVEVLEIKTEDMSAADSLNPMLGGVARPAHVLQTRIAMMATGLQRGRILYVLKGARKPKDAFIEHIVERDDMTIAEVKSLAAKCVGAVEFAETLLDKETPESDFQAHISAVERLRDCTMKSKGQAKYCELREFCFPKKGKE